MSLVRWCLAILVICSCAIALARMVGQQQPLPENIGHLHLSECELPCWIGIVPEKSTISEAQAEIQRVFGNNPNYIIKKKTEYITEIHIISLGANIEIGLQPMSYEDIEYVTVYSIVIIAYTSDPLKISLGQLMNLLGEPTHIGLSPTMYYSAPVLFFKNYRVWVYMSETTTLCRDISISDSIVSLDISADQPSEKAVDLFEVETWKGFKTCYDFSDK